MTRGPPSPPIVAAPVIARTLGASRRRNLAPSGFDASAGPRRASKAMIELSTDATDLLLAGIVDAQRPHQVADSDDLAVAYRAAASATPAAAVSAACATDTERSQGICL